MNLTLSRFLYFDNCNICCAIAYIYAVFFVIWAVRKTTARLGILCFPCESHTKSMGGVSSNSDSDCVRTLVIYPSGTAIQKIEIIINKR